MTDGKQIHHQKTIQFRRKYARMQCQALEQISQNRHQNIMTCYGHIEQPLKVYLFMQLCRGSDLDKLIRNYISQIKVMSMFRQIIDAMAYMHNLDIPHRDMKPANIMLDENNNIKIADLGMARHYAVGMTEGIGSPLYMAPEVFLQSNTYGKSCDVWSVGLILYEMLTGRPLITAQTRYQLALSHRQYREGKRRVTYDQEFNKKWQYLTNMMVQYDPIKRATFAQVLTQFDKHKDQMHKQICQRLGINNIPQALPIQQLSVILQQQISPEELIAEDNSRQNLRLLKNFFQFTGMKTKYCNKLFKNLPYNQYAQLKNVYKYMLCFLAAGSCISTFNEVVRQIDQRKIKTADTQFTLVDFVPNHHTLFQHMLDQFKTAFESDIALVKLKVLKNNLWPHFDEYIDREQKRTIIKKTGDILKLIQDSKQDKYSALEIYQLHYQMIMNNKNAYKKSQKLKQNLLNDVRTYMYIRILGKMNKVFLEQKYIDSDYMTKRIQEIQNMNMEQMIKVIEAINLQ